MKLKRRKRAKWYMQYIGECPVCGRNAGWKEARYTRPPAKIKRYEYLPDQVTFDGCIY
jgi:hypothetical protein